MVVDARHLAEHRNREDGDGADGEVDVPGEHEHRLRDRDEPDDRDLQQDHRQVAMRQEVLAHGREDRAHHEQRYEQAAALVVRE